MNHLLKLLLLPVMVMGICTVKSQNLSFGVAGSIGAGKVSSGYPLAYVISPRFALSGNLGMYLEQKLSEKSSLGIEATWVQIGSKYVNKDQTVLYMSGGIAGIVSSKDKLYSSYLGLPVYYRFQLGKFGIKAGVQPMIFLFARSTSEVFGVIDNEPFHEKGSVNDVKLHRMDFGPKLGADYQLCSRFRIRADYYHGLSNLNTYKTAQPLRNRQITVGMSYQF